VNQFGRVGIVANIDDGALTFPETQQRSGKLVVIKRGRDDVVRSEFDPAIGYPQGVVGVLAGTGLLGQHRARRKTGQRHQAGTGKQGTAVDRHALLRRS
jgi:hypothetical protein